MKLVAIELSNYRNYADLSVKTDGDICILEGQNATGKTNLLESIYLGAIGKSARLPRDRDLIRFESDYAYVKLTVQKKNRAHTIEIQLDRSSKKRIAINGMPIAKLGELFGVLNVVYFSPDELKLVKEAPEYRRHFMDVSLCQQSKKYYYALTTYNKILLQRNNLLKETMSLRDKEDTLPLWDAQLAEAATEITLLRIAYVNELAKRANAVHKELTNGGENLQVSYKRDSLGYTSQEIFDELKEKLVRAHDKDLSLGYTTVGVHRDDIDLSIDGVDVKKFGSQGQQRTTVLSLKISEISVFKARTGETPVLLLDDVLSELDATRVTQLLNATRGFQAFITCTDYNLNDQRSTLSTETITSDTGTIKLTQKQ